MKELQQRLKDIVLANPDKFNRDKIQPLFDYNWNDCRPLWRDIIQLHEWLVPFQVKFTTDEHKLIEESVAKMGLSIVNETFSVPAKHNIALNDPAKTIYGSILKIAVGLLTEKAQGKISKYVYRVCVKSSCLGLQIDTRCRESETLWDALDYIAKSIQRAKESATNDLITG